MELDFYISRRPSRSSRPLLVITQHNAVHALLYLIVSLLAVAVIFFTLGAPFVAALEVIIYAGAIMVLFVFVVMMLNSGRATVEQERGWLSPGSLDRPGSLAARCCARACCTCFCEPAAGLTGAGPVAREAGRHRRSSGRTCLASSWPRCCCWPALVGAYHLGSAARAMETHDASIPMEHGLMLGGHPVLLGLVGRAGAAQPPLHAHVDRDHAQRGRAGLRGRGRRWGQPDGQVMFLFILAMAAAEVCVGLALVLQLYRRFKHARRRRGQ